MAKLIALLKFMPALIAVIIAIEQAIPIGGQGQAKLDLILGASKDIYDSSTDLQREVNWDTLATFIIKAAARLVALFNAIGIFKTSQPAAVG